MADTVEGAGVIVTAHALNLDIRVPSKDQFGGDPYKGAGELGELAAALYQKWPDRLKAASECEIRFLWKAAGGSQQGKPTYADTVKASGLVSYFAGCDFVIWFAADHLYEIAFMQELLEPLMFRQLCHIGRNENTKTLNRVGPDFTGFTSEVEAYGMWDVALKELGRVAMKQPGLFDGLEAPEGWGPKPSNLSKFPHSAGDAEAEQVMRQRGRRGGRGHDADADEPSAATGELVGAGVE